MAPQRRARRRRSAPARSAPEHGRQLLERVVHIYERNLAECAEGRAYLAEIGISDEGLIAKHRIGYCNGRLNEILPQGGDLRSDLRKLGILTKNDGEHFNGCILVPILDIDGNVINLYGGYIEDPATRYWTGKIRRDAFLPKAERGLWNITAIKTYSEIILTGTVLDALSLEVVGYGNVVATQGTDGPTAADLKLFEEFGVQKIINLPDDVQPRRMLAEDGREALAEMITALVAPADADGSAPETPEQQYRSFSVVYGMRRYRVMGLERRPRRLKATVKVEQGGRMHVDTIDLYSARARRSLCQDICRTFCEPPETIESEITRLIQECEKRDAESMCEIGEEDSVQVNGKDRAEAEAFGRSPDLIDTILADYEKCGLIGEQKNKLLSYLAVTSRKMETPLSVLILSSSGAGKTALQDVATSFCPPEDLTKITTMSGKALFYKHQLSLKHKVLALEEREGVVDANYAIRNLITARVLVSESTVRDTATGRLTTQESRVEGPTAVFITSTDPMIDPETRSRFFVTSIDESREQTRAILSYQRQQHTLDGLHSGLEKAQIHRRHHNFQRLLKPVRVVNPFAARLTYADDRLQGRRDQPKYLNLIKAVAFLRQMVKTVKQAECSGSVSEYIEVDLADIRIANELAQDVLGKNLDELSAPGKELLGLLEEMIQRTEDTGDDANTREITFSRRDIREFTGWSAFRVHMHMRELVEFEYVEVDHARAGTAHRYRLAVGDREDGLSLGLTPVNDLVENEGEQQR